MRRLQERRDREGRRGGRGRIREDGRRTNREE